MENQQSNTEKILFGYSCTPSCGYYGEDDGGFSIEIDQDGKFIYKTYIFCRTEKKKAEYKVSENAVNAIKHILEDHKTDINDFDDNLDNGSCDGNGNFFIFNGKQIITWNIQYIDEKEINSINPEYYKEYLPVIQQENLILTIFWEVTEILKTQGIYLKLNSIRFR